MNLFRTRGPAQETVLDCAWKSTATARQVEPSRSAPGRSGAARSRVWMSVAFQAAILSLVGIACSSDSESNPSDLGPATGAGTGGALAGNGGAGGVTAGSGGFGAGSGGTTGGSGGVTGGSGGMTAGSGGMMTAGSGGMMTAGSGGSAGTGTDAGAGGTGGDAGMGGSGGSGDTDRILPPVDSVDADGPFDTTIDEDSDHWVFRPTELGQDGLKHPVFVWGTGATAVPSQYTDHFSRMASHGFVIVAPTPASLNSRLMTAALDWILAENDRMGSPYYQQLDPERVAMGGHSQGSTSTFDAEANEDRLVTTIHIAGGSFDGRGSSKVKTPTAYICGETDFALSNCQRDFENVEDQPTFFSVLSGVDHVACAREALPGMIAWLRWHLAGETERAEQFTGPDGLFFQGIWASETKNWTW